MNLSLSIIDILPSDLTFKSPFEHFNFFEYLVIGAIIKAIFFYEAFVKWGHSIEDLNPLWCFRH